MIVPARNAPKSACMPTTSVTSADAKSNSEHLRHPPPRQRVMLAIAAAPRSRPMAGLTAHTMTTVNDASDAHHHRQRSADAAGGRQCHDQRQQRPRRHVVNRRARQRRRSERRLRHPALFEDARQHRKRGDAEGDAHEQRERMERNSRRRIVRIQRQRRDNTEQERHDDAEVADGDSGRSALPQVSEVDFQPDAEHEEDDSELTQKLQNTERRVREEKRRGGGPDLPEERWTEHQSGGNLADDGRLAQPCCDRARQSASRER